jgi:hypothetical protein
MLSLRGFAPVSFSEKGENSVFQMDPVKRHPTAPKFLVAKDGRRCRRRPPAGGSSLTTPPRSAYANITTRRAVHADLAHVAERYRRAGGVLGGAWRRGP